MIPPKMAPRRRRGRLFPAACLLSLLLLAGTLGLWAATRSSPRAVAAERSRAYALGSHDGRLYASVTTLLTADPSGGGELETPLSPAWRARAGADLPVDLLTCLALGGPAGRSFGAVRDLHGLVGPPPGKSFATDFAWSRRRTSAVMFPHWSAATVFGLLPMVWISRRATRALRTRRRRRQGRCAGCGYDLRGTPGTCPECGDSRDT
jgi:hypothetical protein